MQGGRSTIRPWARPREHPATEAGTWCGAPAGELGGREQLRPQMGPFQRPSEPWRLEGTFKDFGLADIFQLVGLQKKTGVLTVRGEAGRLVTVSFEKGMVVFADEFQRTEAERLGNVLLRTRLLSQGAAGAGDGGPEEHRRSGSGTS